MFEETLTLFQTKIHYFPIYVSVKSIPVFRLSDQNGFYKEPYLWCCTYLDKLDRRLTVPSSLSEEISANFDVSVILESRIGLTHLANIRHLFHTYHRANTKLLDEEAQRIMIQ